LLGCSKTKHSCGHPGQVCELRFLKTLDLSHNLLTKLPKEIGNLIHLEELRISGNRLKSLDENIVKLKGLSKLWLSGNRLSLLPSSICTLTSLELLGLGDNQLSCIPDEIHNLKGLQKLWLSGNKLEKIPSTICKLSHLRKLDVNNNRLIELPVNIGNLINLTFIDVCSNSIENIPSSIERLTKLETLLVNNNNLTVIDEHICNISSLKTLNLSYNNITFIPENISNLINLISFDLNENNLNTLPNSIGELVNLKALMLNGSVLKELPEALFKLLLLKVLMLDRNSLVELPDGLKKLKTLEVLRLSDNELSYFPECINDLPLLKEVSLSGNKIKEIPSWVIRLDINFIWKSDRNSKGSNSGINLYDNPLENPPIEIVAAGTSAIINYFDSFTDSKLEDSITLYEGKLLIVGEGDVGKTHLANQLMYGELPENKTTQGIDIHDWVIDTAKIQNFKVNLWDFAGQAICHATHQFFLTRRSLYLFIWEARSDQDETHFDYWLNIIKLLSKNSPVLIVMNKCDVRIKAIDQAAIQKEFPNVIGFHEISALTGTGVEQLKQRIFDELENLPMIGKKLIKQWIKIREALAEKHKSNFITYKQYLNICDSFNVSPNKASSIAQYYHDLGVILHFHDDIILGDKVILNPEWATDAVYAVVDNMEIQKNYGKFYYKDLSEIWRNYPAETHAFLIELMKKFELCFELPGNEGFIVPELLNPTQATFEWDYRDNLNFEYQYNFMPAGIITRFTVRQHEIIDGDNYWKNGVCLLWNDTKAIIKCDPFAKIISVRIVGFDSKGLLAIIRKEIESIHGTLNDPKFEERIPCICLSCIKSEDSSFHLYSKIKKFIHMRKKTIECDNGEDIYITELLGEYGMERNNNSEKNTYNIYSENAVIGDHARVNSDDIGGDKIISSALSEQRSKSKKKWYEIVALWVGIPAGLIGIYVFVSPLISDFLAK
jgi:internalin A